MTKLHIIAGSEISQSFQLKDPVTYLGRSNDNDIQIKDQTVSRRHLKITRRGNKYFITDLQSQNGTFFNGNFIAPGIEIEVSEGVPIAIGMIFLCMGEGCVEAIRPVLDSTGFTTETGEHSGIFLVHREKTNQKKLELLYRVSEILNAYIPIHETLEKILDHIFDLLQIIDNVICILIDPETEEILDVISRSNKPGADASTLYCRDVVRQVIEDRKPLAISNVHTEEKEDDEIVDTLKILRIESVMCVPLISNSQIMGVIYIDSQKRPFGFADEDLSLFIDLCQRTAIAIDNARFALIDNDISKLSADT